MNLSVFRKRRCSSQFVQVAYTIDGVKTRKREVDPLISVAKKTGCKDLLLITDHDHDTISEDGVTINIVTAREWLLGFLY